MKKAAAMSQNPLDAKGIIAEVIVFVAVAILSAFKLALYGAKFVWRSYKGEPVDPYTGIRKAAGDGAKKTATAEADAFQRKLENEGVLVVYESKATPIEIAVAHATVCLGKHEVILRLYETRITRVLKERVNLPHHRTHFGGHSRKELPPFDEDVAMKAGLPFDMEGAIAFTKQELSIYDKAQPKSAKAKEKRAETPATKVKAAPEMVELDHSYDHDHHDTTKASSKEATGRVIEAGNKEFRFEGKRPYKSFSIVLQTEEGEAIFSGNDLAKKFEEGLFKVGDIVCVVQRTSFFETEAKGETRRRKKNDFTITVIR